MEKLTQLVEQLAAKLGVAVDLIWDALLRQALIAGIGDLIWIAVLSVGIFWIVRWGKWIANVKNRVDEIAWLPFGLVATAACIALVATICCLPMTLAAFFNPNYWALHEILGQMK